jgi:hypothetical protein
MYAHRAADTIKQGSYQYREPTTATGYRGCAIGCTLPLINDTDKYANGWWWQRVEDDYGIDRHVAELIDGIFETQETFGTAARFAVEAVEAIPVGADLSSVRDDWRDMYIGSNASIARQTDWLLDLLANAPVPVAT